ncbi:hypothetical protein BDC45DRAFT_529968 [Circinella umbellata]|nr:hypothetical protein BDC45DRAFT_529968 [Circinella umbellata]
MIRREPTAITLNIHDVEELQDLKQMYQQEEEWRTQMAKNSQQGNHDIEYLLDQAMDNKNTKDDNNNNNTNNEVLTETVPSNNSNSNSFLTKRRRIANNSSSQRRSADARKRLGVDQQQQPIYKMGRQV